MIIFFLTPEIQIMCVMSADSCSVFEDLLGCLNFCTKWTQVEIQYKSPCFFFVLLCIQKSMLLFIRKTIKLPKVSCPFILKLCLKIFIHLNLWRLEHCALEAHTRITRCLGVTYTTDNNRGKSKSSGSSSHGVNGAVRTGLSLWSTGLHSCSGGPRAVRRPLDRQAVLGILADVGAMGGPSYGGCWAGLRR